MTRSTHALARAAAAAALVAGLGAALAPQAGAEPGPRAGKLFERLDADDSGADDSCGHDNGAHYDGSVFGDVQGCKLLGSRILRAVLWIQAGQHGGLSAS